eukprot:m.73238 g.73238  ORF g.73238 m.73238 type:complete len:392 (+) comp12364_c0_seq1:138-1313(+)
MARASAAFEDDFPSLLPKRSKPLLLHRSSSFRQLMNRTDTHTVDSWLTSLTSQPSLTRGSSTFSRFTTPESAGNFHWAEETVCLDLCPDDIQPMSSVFQPSTPAKPAAQKKPSLSLSIDMPATPGAKISYWVYSHLLHQFFSGLNVEYPVTLASDRPVPQGAMLTMHLEYIKEAQKSQPVVRCPQHADQDEEADLSNHVLRSSNKLATYETSPITGVNRIAVPIKLSKRDGTLQQTELLKMACYSSCTGGINRRLVKMVFSIVHKGEVLASTSSPIRVCACPGRDCRNLEKASAASTLADISRESRNASCLCDVVDLNGIISVSSSDSSLIHVYACVAGSLLHDLYAFLFAELTCLLVCIVMKMEQSVSHSRLKQKVLRQSVSEVLQTFTI